jgi:hypothetical protein
MAEATKEGAGPYESKLGEGAQRFLAHAVENSLQVGRRTPDDFIRHFPPGAIMQGLRDQPQLRANILVIATGVRGKIALKKSAESCGNDLQIALDEGEADAETVVQLFDPDDRVRYLDAKALWSFLTEGKFWQIERDKDRTRHGVAAQHIAYMIDRALRDRLLSHRDVVDGITVGKLAELLPRPELAKIIAAALDQGHAQKAYVEQNLLAAAPSGTLVEHVPLSWIWEQVVVPKIAEALGIKQRPLVEAPPAAAAPKEEAKAPPAAKEAAPPPAAPRDAPPAEDAEPPSDDGMDLEIEDILAEPKPKTAPVPRPMKR